VNELEQLRAHVAGASTATDREVALAYLGAARSVGRRLHDELRATAEQIAAIEGRVLGVKRGAQVPLVEGT